LAIDKHNILKTISDTSIGICPGNILLDPTMGGAKNLSWMIPEKNNPPTNWNVTPHPIATHCSNDATPTFALGAQAAILMRFNPEV